MKRISQFSIRKKLLITICVVLLVGGGLSLRLTHTWPFNSQLASDLDATRNEKTAHPTPKNNNPPSKQSLNSSSTENQTSDQVPVNADYVANITQLDESNGQIHFAASVKNTSDAGTCVVTFSNANDRPVTQQFTATNASDTSTCTVSISANEFSYVGVWQVSFHYYVNDKQATAQGQITIQ